jgi:hypothetical protein
LVRQSNMRLLSETFSFLNCWNFWNCWHICYTYLLIWNFFIVLLSKKIAVPTIFVEIIRVDIQVRIWNLHRLKSMFFSLLVWIKEI